MKLFKRLFRTGLILLTFLYFLPKTCLFLIVCGLWDVSRNKPLNTDTLLRYFTGNGLLTWILSPLNILIDCMSSKNIGVFQLNQLPMSHQQEIQRVIDAAHDHRNEIKQTLDGQLSQVERGMLFFKWYAKNQPSSLTIDAFQKQYQYIRSIGVSVFNANCSTSIHYGPLRFSYRVLYNLFPTDSDKVYIETQGSRYYWKDNPLFIFDDTLQHQSINDEPEKRYCMFIDILRPSPTPVILDKAMRLVQFFTKKINGIFYRKWTFLR